MVCNAASRRPGVYWHTALRTRTGTGTGRAWGVRGYGITVHHTLISTSPTVHQRGLASRR